jgi:hypothetical protein
MDNNIHPIIEDFMAKGIGTHCGIAAGVIRYRHRGDSPVRGGIFGNSGNSVNGSATRFAAGNQFESYDKFIRN